MAAKNSEGINAIWDRLKEGLNIVYAKSQLSVGTKDYMDYYSNVYNFCTRASAEDAASRPITAPIIATRRQTSFAVSKPVNCAEFIGADLYERLRIFIEQYTETLLQKCQDLNGYQLLEKYTTLWKEFQFSSTVVNGIFAYLNRHWIKRENDEGHHDIYEVYTLAVVTWKKALFEDLHPSLTASILDLIEHDRRGEKIQTSLVRNVIDSYLELGINEEPELNNMGQLVSLESPRVAAKLKIYKYQFEAPFLQETRTFYMAEANDFLSIQQNSVTEYLKKVERRLQEEHDRCDLYLNSSTQDPLAKTLDDVLISQHLELIHAEFEILLNDQKDDDLSRMYRLCARVDGALEKLKAIFEQHIKRIGSEAIRLVASTAINDPKQYVDTILSVHKRFFVLVADAFQSDAGFTQSMDKALESFINRNAVTEAAKNVSKSPELLARYCDTLLRKSPKNPEELELEELLNQIVIVFKYIEDKDVYQVFYSKMLAKRLVYEASASDDAESNMISKLKQMCGYEYISKLLRMFNDARISRELTDDYKQYISEVQLESDAAVSMSIMVLASGTWPFPNSGPSFEMPQQLQHCMDGFNRFYTKRHNGRRLVFLFHMCRGEVTFTGKHKRKYSFMVTTQQIAVLMLFNDATEYTLREICERSKMEYKHLFSHLQPMVKVGLMKLSAEESELDDSTPMDTQLILNSDFQNKKVKVDLMKNLSRSEVKKDSDEVQKAVDDNRIHVIKAATVRIMKMRKALKHNDLIQEIIQQLVSRFQPKVPTIKRAIDLLIEQEYIKRSENDRQTYEYMT